MSEKDRPDGLKTCASCGETYEPLRHVCPNCGETSGLLEISVASDVLRRQAKASDLVTKASKLFQKGRFEKARRVLGKAIETNPFNGTAYGNMGYTYYIEENYSEAIPWLEKALELHPNLEGIAEALAECRVRNKGALS